MIWICQNCNKHFTHQSAHSRHVHGNPKSGHKPCTRQTNSEKDTYPELTCHLREPSFPPFLSQTQIADILRGDLYDIPVKVLQSIHLQPDINERRAYCNVYWPNKNIQEVIVYDGTGWVIKPFNIWTLDFCRWIYKAWTQLDESFGDRDVFLRYIAERGENKEWDHMSKMLRSSLLHSGFRKPMKKIFKFH